MLSLEGREIGGCKLIRKIGEGGMGLVYLAEQLDAGNRLVAVKIVRATDASFSNAGADVVRRFKREAALLKNLSYPNILPIYGSGVEDDLLYIITPYAQAGSLSDAIRGRSATHLQLPAPLDLTMDIISQVAAALQYCHDRGIVHRDVKPGNVLIQIEKGGHWRMLLADFGVARPEQTTTAQTMVTGTFAYMAPEQFTAQFSPASDQYALAVMTYQLLAGRVPFEGDLIALSRGHLYEDPPPLAQFNPNVPPGVEAVIRRGLAKDPEDRYPAVELFAEALQATAAGVPYEQSPGYDPRAARRTPPPPAAKTPPPRNTPAKGNRSPSWPVDLAPPKRKAGPGRIVVALVAAILLVIGLVAAPGILNAQQQALHAQQTAAAQTASAQANKTPSTTRTAGPTVTAAVSPTATTPPAPTATAPGGSVPAGTGAQQFVDPSPTCDSPLGPNWGIDDQTDIKCVPGSGVKVTAKAAPQFGCIEQSTPKLTDNYIVTNVTPGSGSGVLGFRLGSQPSSSGTPTQPFCKHPDGKVSVGYYFAVNATAGTYSLFRVDNSGAVTPPLAAGTVSGVSGPFTMGATFKGSNIALYVNGTQVGSTITDSKYSSGSMGLCTDGNATFKDAQIYAFS